MSSALVALLSTLVVPLDTLVAAVRHPSGRAIRQLSTPVGELQDSVHIDTENVDRTVLGDLLPLYGQQTKLNQRREILFYMKAVGASLPRPITARSRSHHLLSSPESLPHSCIRSRQYRTVVTRSPPSTKGALPCHRWTSASNKS